jgi:hypothetical protein
MPIKLEMDTAPTPEDQSEIAALADATKDILDIFSEKDLLDSPTHSKDNSLATENGDK